MRSSLIFLTFVGFVACSGSSPWQVNQHYEYTFSANTLTGYGLEQNQYVGIVSQGKLVLQPESESVVRGKLSQVRHAHFHDELKDGLNSEIPERMLHFNDQPSADSMFRINYENGVIRSLEVDPSLSNDEVNQLKAILSQLQVDTTGENVIKCRYNQLPSETNDASSAFYKTMEESVMGKCEMLYEMSAVPDYIEAGNESGHQWSAQPELNLDGNHFQVVKTTNFSNCAIRRGYHFGIPGASDMKPHSNQMGEFLSKTAVTRVLIAGNPLNRFTIKSAETENRVAVSALLYDEEQADVVSRIAVHLQKIEPSQYPLRIKSEKLIRVGNLVYQYNIPSDVNNQVRSSVEGVQGEDRQRHRRSIDKSMKKMSTVSSSSSSSESDESSEEFNSPQYAAKNPHQYQPFPSMAKAAEKPLLPFFVGNKGRSIQHHEAIEPVPEACKLAQEISTDLQNPATIPERDTIEKYTILTAVIQTMNYEQIEQVAESLKGRQSNGQWSEQLAYDTLLDACAQAGTNPAASWIVHAVSNGQIEQSNAASLLETVFRNLRTPTEQIVRDIFENVIKNDQVWKENAFYPKILITFSDLLRRSYSDKNSAKNFFPVNSFGSFEKGLGDIVTKEIIPWLGKRLAENINNKNHQHAQQYIRALGNVAHPKMVEIFEPYLENEKSASQFERLSMVAAFDKLVESYPRYSQNILYKLFANVQDKPEIRSMAVTLYMRAAPPAAMLQRMATATYTDPSIAVRSTIKSAINSAAQLTSSDNADLAANARAAQQFLNPYTYGLQHSKTALRDYVSDMLEISENIQMTHIIGPESAYPKVFSYNSWKNYGGISSNDIDVQLLLADVQKTWDTLVADDASPKSHRSKYSVHRIAQQLGINFESDDTNDVSGQILFKLLSRKNFFAFDKKSLKSAPKQVASFAKELMSGRRAQYNKIYDHDQIVVAFPLATGYPFYYAYMKPTLVQAVGEIKAKTTPSLTSAKSWSDILAIEAINVTAKLTLVMSTNEIGKVGFFTPFESQRYVAGQIKKSQVHLPLSLNLNIDLKNTAISGKISPLAGQAAQDQNQIELVHSSSWPFTARKNVYSLRPVSEAKDLKLIHLRPTVESQQTIGEKSVGMAFEYSLQHQFPQSAINNVERLLQSEGAKQYAQLPVNFILTMNNLLEQKSPISLAQFMPFVFEPATQSSPAGSVLTSLLTMPFYEELGSTEMTKMRAMLHLATMSLAGASELKAAAMAEDVSADGVWPTVSLAQHKFSMSLDLGRSSNQAMKFGVQFENEDNYDSSDARRSEKPLSSSDESKLAVVSDISPNSGSRREEMLSNAGRGMKQAVGGLIDSAIVFEGSKPAKFVFTAAQARSVVGDKTRVLLFANAKTAARSSSNQLYVSYVQSFANTPALNYEQAEKHDGKSNAKLTVIFGEGGKPKNSKINISAVLKQSQDFKEQVRQSAIVRECVREMREEGNNQMPACLKATYQANLLDEIDLHVEAEQLSSGVKNWGYAAHSALNHWGYYNLRYNASGKGSQGKIEAQIKLNPLEHTMSLTLQLPSVQQEFTGISVPRFARHLLSVHPGMNLNERMKRTLTRNSEVCVVDQNKIVTFDSAIAEGQKLGKCWYAVVQHRGSQNDDRDDEVSILIRQADKASKQKEVLIVASGQRIQLTPSQDSRAPPHVTVNEKPQTVSDKYAIEVRGASTNKAQSQKPIVARIYAISENDLKVELGHPSTQLRVYYSGGLIRVHADPMLRNQVAGLCGNYNGEPIDDIATPHEKVLQNETHYSAAWAIPDENCAADVKKSQQNALASRSYEVQYQAANVVSQFENGKKSYGKAQPSDKRWQSSESSSSSSSSSSESDEHDGHKTSKGGNPPCRVIQRIQYVNEGDQYCFTIQDVDACPNHCAKRDVTEVSVSAHCRDTKDSVAAMFVQQIRRGSNPDLSSKQVHRTIQIKVPGNCVAKQ